MSSTKDAARNYMKEALDQLAETIDKIIKGVKATDSPSPFTSSQLAEALEDRELLALDAWTRGEDKTFSDECKRRQADHEQLARRFASRGPVELVAILAERVRS